MEDNDPLGHLKLNRYSLCGLRPVKRVCKSGAEGNSITIIGLFARQRLSIQDLLDRTSELFVNIQIKTVKDFLEPIQSPPSYR